MKINPVRGTHDLYGQQVLKYKTIQDLIVYLEKEPKTVVVECNQEVFKGTDTRYTLRNNDSIEIVHFVGGGSAIL